MTSSQIRRLFLNYFSEKKHEIVPSAPIVQKNDPTLMFTNSGMVQFKEYFLGNERAPYPRIADSQKCLRVSGKHNDLDDVGKDTYHHTMFEMLGNWSFNNYFKKEAIAWAWEFLTEVVKIDKENLYVTVFEGDASEKLPKDDDSYDIWKEHIAEDRILYGNKKDNFWEMGEQGPCGPSSEIHVDVRTAAEKEKTPAQELINKDHPQVIEVWNLVFMENLRRADGSIHKLDTKNVDTGMGFERLCMVLQGKESTYDTDVFSPLINKLNKLTGINYGDDDKTDIAIRVVVDHLRAVAFSISDGQLPSNTGAGYVIRRILRRAISYGYRNLNQKSPFIFKLVDTLVMDMGDAYPELFNNSTLIKEVIEEEENSFLNTIEKGLQRLDDLIHHTPKGEPIKGELIYDLKDTYGFPPDLSRIIAEENGYSIDEDGFTREEKRIKDISKKASLSKTSDWVLVNEEGDEQFMGHDILRATVKINKYREIENNKGTFYQVVFNQTPFYAEGGGQVGDSGEIANAEEKIKVIDTQKETGLIYSTLKSLPMNVSAEFEAIVNAKKRIATTRNHTATHLLHHALREVLGQHVEQKGSLVNSKELRFDFSYFQKMTEEEIKKVEDRVNAKIKAQIPMQEYAGISLDEAKEKGAMALFGEKYGETVRMIQFDDSKELCGGSHVKNTLEIFNFKIISESSIASGIRRIYAITGDATLQYYQKLEEELNAIKEVLNQPTDVVRIIEKQQDEIGSLKNEIENLYKQQAKGEKQIWMNLKEDINGIQYIGIQSDLDVGNIKDLIFQIKSEEPKSVLVVTSLQNEKPNIMIGVGGHDNDINASDMVRQLAKEIEGGGGGQSTFASAGGKNAEGLDRVLIKAKEYIESKTVSS